MPATAARRATIFAEMVSRGYRETDRMFQWLLLAQWAFAIGIALVISPYTYDGATRHLHVHVRLAIGGGALLNFMPILLIHSRPGAAITRHVVAFTQMLWSAMLIMLTGGRIETHFHVFGSLAFLAFYRDWKLLVTATLVVAADHLARGLWWPDSVYGVLDPEWWRFLEHAAWVTFENIVLVFGCVRGVRELRAAAAREASLERESIDRYKALVETTAAIPFEWDRAAGRPAYIAPQMCTLLGCTMDELLAPGFLWSRWHPDDGARLAALSARFAAGDRAPNEPIDLRVSATTGEVRHVRMFQSAATAGGQLIRGVMIDITRQTQLEADLRQAQKLESVGRLATGVAHEINTPVQFVGDSIQFVRDSLDEVFAALDPQAVAADGELAYLVDQYPKALDRALDGVARVATIVRSMKTYAHPETAMTAIELAPAVDSALALARNEYKYVADVETQHAELPRVHCHAGALGQVVLNLVVNAAHAIADVVGNSGARGKITVATRRDGDHVVISVADTGGGIPERVRERVFDYFFTTKEVGRGTGQGLALARAVIVDKHAGTLTFDTQVGRGTTFYVRIPIAPPAAPARELEAAA